MGHHMLGIARTEQGAVPEGIGMLRQAMQTTQAIRVESGISAMHLMIADAALKSGLIGEGLGAIDHGFARVKSKDEHARKPELHRLHAANYCSSSFGTVKASGRSSEVTATPRIASSQRANWHAHNHHETGKCERR